MNRTSLRSSLLLFLTATIWGSAFVAQSVGMDYVGPFTFNGVRSLIAAVFLFAFLQIRSHIRQEKNVFAGLFSTGPRPLLAGGICCGLALTLATMFQQYGILSTSVGKAGFLTAVYIVIVPILGLFLHKKCRPVLWLGVALALVGLYLLSVTDGFGSVGTGDILLLISAFLFSIHILVIDHFSPRCDGVAMSCIQFLVSAVLCLPAAFLLEPVRPDTLCAAAVPILYAGILSSGVAYTLQIVAQKDVNPTLASLILSLESVMAALTGWLILGQSLSARELAGCGAIFAAILLAQFSGKAS